MAKASGARSAKPLSVKAVEQRVLDVARALQMELVEVVCQKESRGQCLCLYIDKDGGVTLDDCERFHKQVQPLLEDVDYDFLEVSSPGVDRPIKTLRDFQKNRGALVEARLFAPVDGRRLYQGAIVDMNDETVTLEIEGARAEFPRKNVASVKPVIQLDDSDFELPELDEGEEEP